MFDEWFDSSTQEHNSRDGALDETSDSLSVDVVFFLCHYGICHFSDFCDLCLLLCADFGAACAFGRGGEWHFAWLIAWKSSWMATLVAIATFALSC